MCSRRVNHPPLDAPMVGCECPSCQALSPPTGPLHTLVTEVEQEHLEAMTMCGCKLCDAIFAAIPSDVPIATFEEEADDGIVVACGQRCPTAPVYCSLPEGHTGHHMGRPTEGLRKGCKTTWKEVG